MKVSLLKRTAMFGVLLALTVIATGCGGGDGGSSPDSQASDNDHDGHDHSGWWCVEHGIPEEECSMCSAKAAAAFKEKDDWCEEHNRAESQCFKCDPTRAEKYAKLYEAKFGEKPPKPTE